MHPIIAQIGPFTIYSYGLMLVAGFLLAASLAQAQAKRQALDPDFVFNFAFFVFISGIVGGRVFFVLGHMEYYLKNPLEVVMLQHGGLAWFGGMFGGIAGAAIFTRRKRVAVYELCDLLVPFVALGQSLGRIGCFLNGCCYGKPAHALCVFSQQHGSCLIPTQLYSAMALAGIFVVLRLLQERPHRQGQILYAYLMLYSLKRFVIEFFRNDTPPLWGPLTIFHVLSAVVFCVAAVQSVRIARRPLSSP